jgi:hypothetical protein
MESSQTSLITRSACRLFQTAIVEAAHYERAAGGRELKDEQPCDSIQSALRPSPKKDAA